MPNPHTNNDLVGREERPQGGKYCDSSEAKYALKERTRGRERGQYLEGKGECFGGKAVGVTTLG